MGVLPSLEWVGGVPIILHELFSGLLLIMLVLEIYVPSYKY